MPVKGSTYWRTKKKVQLLCSTFSLPCLCWLCFLTLIFLGWENLTPLLYPLENSWPSWYSYQEVKMGWLRSKGISSVLLLKALFIFSLIFRRRRKESFLVPLNLRFIHLTSKTWYKGPLSSSCVTPSPRFEAPEGTQAQCWSPWRLSGWSMQMPVPLRPSESGFWCFYASSTISPNPAEMRRVQLGRSLPPSVGLAVCLLVTHRCISFMVAWCLSGIFHPRNVLPIPKWREVVLDGEALHTVLGSLHHVGVVELLMITLCLANKAISSLCTNACPPEKPLTMAMFQWKHILTQPHQFGFYSFITNTLWFCRQPKPKILVKGPFVFWLSHDISTQVVITRISSPDLWFFLPATSSLRWTACCRNTDVCEGRCSAHCLYWWHRETCHFPFSLPDQSYHRYLVCMGFFQTIVFLSWAQINCFFDNKIKNQWDAY